MKYSIYLSQEFAIHQYTFIHGNEFRDVGELAFRDAGDFQ